MKRKSFYLLWILGLSILLVACSPKQSSIEKTQPSPSAQQADGNELGDTKKFDKKRKPQDLPKNASEAPKDKIYATDGSEIYYESSSSGFTASIPNFEGYTNQTVEDILGKPSKKVTDTETMASLLKQGEQKRIVALFKKQKLTQEEARAFYAGAADYSMGSLDKYYVYQYSDQKLLLLFQKSTHKLVYVTPDTDYVYWR